MGEYITTQGDMWDSISLRLYGDEQLMHLLIDANLQYRKTAVFPANCVLCVPEVSLEEKTDFPPWWRSG